MKRSRSDNSTALRACRKDLGLTQQELGDLLGVSRNTLRAWELGKEPAFLPHVCCGLRAYKRLPHIFIAYSGGCLVEARKRFGMHQDQLAALLGVSRPTLSRWENDTPPAWITFAVSALAFTE
ncbi:helix-turn-helix domain-containing protein [Pseudomonas syringae]|uniref:helix-turn-helix domain-containing protein n=1 Tax=Pseudomonas syringae TaxID=317 RepID=UPI001F91C705|nr:helix-turn-helix domain-containing protein [Pseudomonas syringae]MCF5382065.1 helix-turn-helix domain-containing protein [Pseudomonas syringae]MCF5419351.1 helix-turn-helix domain-containing protein [Pseudomonas syringae]MCF5455031.1 helix-turn-helix domain-containing protein [Pseudomonas syringae]MCF5460935.1 helix-turn-helix domain-containing protein [Pseudomonas syringae]